MIMLFLLLLLLPVCLAGDILLTTETAQSSVVYYTVAKYLLHTYPDSLPSKRVISSWERNTDVTIAVGSYLDIAMIDGMALSVVVTEQGPVGLARELAVLHKMRLVFR